MKKLFIVFLMLLAFAGHGQKRANIWYFGDYAGLDFNSGSPVVISGSKMRTIEGCATISDTNGSLLFYTDGSNIWDRTHTVMPNGSGLKGHSSATQSGVIIPFPANDDKFFVFTVDERLKQFGKHQGFHYSIVDMSLNSGNGDVTVKNVKLLGSCTEKVTGVRHCNSGDVWVIAHGWNDNKFYSYLITSSGIQLPPVVSSVGRVHGGISGNAQGYMKASPDGRRLACAISWQDKVQYFDFNAETGILSNPVSKSFPPSFKPYGLEFSDNGEILYVSSVNQGIKQLDLLTNNLISLTTMSTSGLQIATDHKIYAAHQSTHKLSTINNPNVLGSGCNLVGNTVTTNTVVREGLPTFNQSLFEGGVTQNFSIEDTCLTDSTAFTMFTSILVDSIVWDFGDPTSLSNESRMQNPKHYYESTGHYNVVLKIYNLNCPIPFIIKKSLNILPKPFIELPKDTIICDYDSIRVKMKHKNLDGFSWSTGNTKDSSIYMKGPGSYTLTAYNECNTVFDDIEISVFDRINTSIENAYLCDGDSILLDAFYPHASYKWQDNSTDSVFMVYQPGLYSVLIKTPCYEKKIAVSIFPDEGPPPTNLGNDTSICSGDSLLLDAAYLLSNYYWNNGQTDSVIWVNKAGTYIVGVENACYLVYDTINVSLTDLATLNLGNDTSVCYYNSVQIQPQTNQDVIYWMDGSTGSSYEASKEGLYTASVSNKCNEIVDSIFVSHDYPPKIVLPSDTVICHDGHLLLEPNLMDADYLWQNGSTLKYLSVSRAGTYVLKVSNECGKDLHMTDIREKDCECTVYLPNTFTPDGNDINGFFGAEYDCEILNFEFTIFNRWGEIIYKSLSIDAKWDGNMPDGNEAPLGVYVYTLSYQGLRNDVPFEKNTRGTVTLLR